MKKSVEVSRNGSVLEVMLNRPKANAIDTNCSKKLAEIFFMFQDDPSLRVAIITGSGDRFFSAGWDLKAEEAVDADHGPGGFAGLTEIFDISKPVIAAVNGMAVGGGFELVLACDLIIAAHHAEFFLPETRVGIIPDAGGVLRLPKVIPRAVALEMLLTGKRLSAKEAYHYGLVNKNVSSQELMKEARKMAEDIITGAPLAITAIKEIVRNTQHISIKEGYAMMRSDQLSAYKQMLHSIDAIEGQKSFIEKRKPVWKGK